MAVASSPANPVLAGPVFMVIFGIGASLSEPHTSESNGGIFIFIYIYLSYVVP